MRVRTPPHSRNGRARLALAMGALVALGTIPLGWQAIVADPGYEIPNVTISLLFLFAPYALLAHSSKQAGRRAFWIALALILAGTLLGIAAARASSTGGIAFLYIWPVQLAVAYGARQFR